MGIMIYFQEIWYCYEAENINIYCAHYITELLVKCIIRPVIQDGLRWLCYFSISPLRPCVCSCDLTWSAFIHLPLIQSKRGGSQPRSHAA